MSDFNRIGETVRARAARELRDRILTGSLTAGTRLDLDEITREFGTSRTPVREALLELSYEGLVTVAPRSGITVVGITPEDAADSFAVLAALSGKAAEWATARILPEDLARLHDLARAIDETGDVVAANWRFHRALNHASGSRRLLVHLGHAVRAVPTSYFDLFPAQEERSRDEHAALLSAMDRGDGTEARALAEAHILEAGDALGDWLKSRLGGDEHVAAPT
jgi:DNA-binding GntR family transcriptional regulator